MFTSIDQTDRMLINVIAGFTRFGTDLSYVLHVSSGLVGKEVCIPVFVSDAAKHSKNELLHNKEERIPQTEELPEIKESFSVIYQ